MVKKNILLLILMIKNKYKFKKFSFIESSLNLSIASISAEHSIDYEKRTVSSFSMDSKIILFFVNLEKMCEIYIYDIILIN